ncbi:nucleotidyltransferase family protein [Vibrio sp. SCSIO 43136]|nr:nucleotidyltransferase family protein [Vibrio sp. SCSIO 43136]
MSDLDKWVRADAFRMDALIQVQSLEREFSLPPTYIGAGFVRNLVWDKLHGYPSPTPLNDLDVVFYAPDLAEDKNKHLQCALTSRRGEYRWQVKNQAYLHHRNQDRPYQGLVDALSFWPEKETAVAVRLNFDGQLEFVSAFGFESLLALELTPNPKRQRAVFDQRLAKKNWRGLWPKLKVVA